MSRRAFTLMELLVAIALVAGLAMAVFGFLDSLLRRRDRLLAASECRVVEGVLFEELERMLPGTCVIDSAGQPGVEGDAMHIHVRGRGVRLGTKPNLSDEVSVVLQFDDASSALNGTRDGESALIGRVGRVRFRYWNGREWVEEFNSAAAGCLPAMVEVRVWFEPVSNGDEATPPDRSRIISIPDAGRGTDA